MFCNYYIVSAKFNTIRMKKQKEGGQGGGGGVEEGEEKGVKNGVSKKFDIKFRPGTSLYRHIRCQ